MEFCAPNRNINSGWIIKSSAIIKLLITIIIYWWRWIIFDFIIKVAITLIQTYLFYLSKFFFHNLILAVYFPGTNDLKDKTKFLLVSLHALSLELKMAVHSLKNNKIQGKTTISSVHQQQKKYVIVSLPRYPYQAFIHDQALKKPDAEIWTKRTPFT